MNGRWLIGIGLVLVCSISLADDDDSQARARHLRQSGDIMAVEQILDKVQKSYHGRLLEVDLEKLGGRYVYEIELVDGKGEVIELFFDAKTGELLKDVND